MQQRTEQGKHWMDGAPGCMDEHVDGLMADWVDGWVDGSMDSLGEWMVGWVDGWVDGWMEEYLMAGRC